MTTIVPSPAPAKKPSAPGQPWSHIETTALIDAYESKWYSLKRGQLKAHQWEEVSAAVAARCGFPEPSKNGTQCRHKIEKLRKRFRAEKNRPLPSLWPYFDRMDRLERGPVPVSAKPLPLLSPPHHSESEESDDEFADEYEDKYSKDVGRGGGERVGLLLEVAGEVRRFAEGMVRVEKRRMEMMRELERDWMEMEAKRAEMVVESQRSMMETIAGTFAAVKKAKKDEDL